MKRWYFTFGFDRFSGGYVVIESDSEIDAREEMMLRYGRNWAFCYDETHFAGQMEKYRLVKIAHILVPIGNSDKKDEESQDA
jgi:hypothetical protein